MVGCGDMIQMRDGWLVGDTANLNLGAANVGAASSSATTEPRDVAVNR